MFTEDSVKRLDAPVVRQHLASQGRKPLFDSFTGYAPRRVKMRTAAHNRCPGSAEVSGRISSAVEMDSIAQTSNAMSIQRPHRSRRLHVSCGRCEPTQFTQNCEPRGSTPSAQLSRQEWKQRHCKHVVE